MSKKYLNIILILSTFLAMIVSSSRLLVNATTQTIQTTFLTSATWFDASGTEVVGNTTTGSPYTILTQAKRYVFSVGSNDTGSNRVLFGATSKGVADTYANFNHASLASFRSLSSNHSFEGVIAQKETEYYLEVTKLTLQWGSGSTPDGYNAKMIYSLDEGLSWLTLGSTITLTPGSSSGSYTFNQVVQGSYLRVGLLLTNNVNTNAIYIQNPEMAIEYRQLTDQEQAEQFASEIEPYSPCASTENEMVQLTIAKQTEFMDKYQLLSTNAKTALSTIAMGEGFTAMDRYQYLSNYQI
jgi:hypothetical protein